MEREVLLVSYSEIALKSRPVRRMLENRLCSHIRTALELEGFSGAKVGRIQGRLIVGDVEPEAAAEAVARVFGVASTMPAIEINADFETIVQTVATLGQRVIEPHQTFAVDARRIGRQGYSSEDIEVASGSEVLKQLSAKGVKVNLEKPDKTIHVEVRGGIAYVYCQVFPGPCGLPFGSQGRLIGLLSGGIDSPVATWLMMRRGAYVNPLFLDQRPFVGEDYFQRVMKVGRRIRRFVPLKNYFLHVAPMGEIMGEIVEEVPRRLTCLVCKRMMYRIASSLAVGEKAEGIVTGESLGQVASQTLANLRVIEASSPLPVYRPLVGTDKDEIVRWAKNIGTYELSIIPAHGCSVVPSKPSAKARIEAVRGAEEKMDIKTLVNEALYGATKIEL